MHDVTASRFLTGKYEVTQAEWLAVSLSNSQSRLACPTSRLKLGVSHGETDEIGLSAAADSVSVHDLHATMLHLLGIDHKRLTYVNSGRRFRLTDVEGELITPILA